jgi:hypothetical protein
MIKQHIEITYWLAWIIGVDFEKENLAHRFTDLKLKLKILNTEILLKLT